MPAAAQQPVPVIGYLSGWSAGDAVDYVAAFHRGLAETGLVEGRNVAVEYRFADYHFDKLPTLVTELVRRQGCRPSCGWNLAWRDLR
jgi:putative tryptophan/tyrosine transport system substrate-binding protein